MGSAGPGDVDDATDRRRRRVRGSPGSATAEEPGAVDDRGEPVRFALPCPTPVIDPRRGGGAVAGRGDGRWPRSAQPLARRPWRSATALGALASPSVRSGSNPIERLTCLFGRGHPDRRRQALGGDAGSCVATVERGLVVPAAASSRWSAGPRWRRVGGAFRRRVAGGGRRCSIVEHANAAAAVHLLVRPYVWAYAMLTDAEISGTPAVRCGSHNEEVMPVLTDAAYQQLLTMRGRGSSRIAAAPGRAAATGTADY